MFHSIAAKALLGVGLLAAAGGTTALAASPSPGAAQGRSQAARAAARHVSRGVVTRVSDTSLTIEHHSRDGASGNTRTDDITFVLDRSTGVYHAGDRTRLGVDAIKTGQRVRVRYTDSAGNKVAHRVVILPDLRAGTVVAKGAGYFTLRTREHGDVRVTVTDSTRFRDGRAAGSFAGLQVGDRAVAAGEEDTAHNFDAVAVRYHAPRKAPPATPPTPAAQ